MKLKITISPALHTKIKKKAKRLSKAFKTKVTPEMVIERQMAFSLRHRLD